MDSGAISASPDPLGSGAISASPDPLGSGAIPVRPTPWPRAQSTPRPGSGLERDQHLTRASASEPGFQYTVAVPLTRRAPCLPRCSKARRPLFQQLPSLWRLTSVTVRHCPTVKEEWEEINPATVSILWLSLFNYCRTSYSAPEPTSTIRTGLRDAPHKTTTLSAMPQGRVADLHRIGTVAPPHTRDNLQTYKCKSPATPCGYKRGGRAPFRHHRTQGTSVVHKQHTPLHIHRDRDLGH